MPKGATSCLAGVMHRVAGGLQALVGGGRVPASHWQDASGARRVGASAQKALRSCERSGKSSASRSTGRARDVTARSATARNCSGVRPVFNALSHAAPSAQPASAQPTALVAVRNAHQATLIAADSGQSSSKMILQMRSKRSSVGSSIQRSNNSSTSEACETSPRWPSRTRLAMDEAAQTHSTLPTTISLGAASKRSHHSRSTAGAARATATSKCSWEFHVQTCSVINNSRRPVASRQTIVARPASERMRRSIAAADEKRQNEGAACR